MGPIAETMPVIRKTYLPFALPTIGEEEIAEVVDSLRSGWITTGPKVKRFEVDFAEYVHATHAIATSSCTDGLHIALTALGIGPGDEVIVPTFTFCASANVVIHLGAKPILVDVGEDFNILPDAIEKAITPRTKAILPVHFGGQACDLNAVYKIAIRHHLPVVEDSAHVIGAEYQEQKIGADSLQEAFPSLVRVTVFSFYATKNMTTGEGGMITTTDDDLAAQMRNLTLHGMNRDSWKRYTNTGSWFYEVVAPGYKDNMSDIQAALGIHQLRRLDDFICIRQAIARQYDQSFAQLPEIEIPITHSDRTNVYHLYPIRLNLDRLFIDRSEFIKQLSERNIGTSVHFIPVHMHPYYQSFGGYGLEDLPNATQLYHQIISLPLYPRMTEEDVQDVIHAVYQIVNINRKT